MKSSAAAAFLSIQVLNTALEIHTIINLQDSQISLASDRRRYRAPQQIAGQVPAFYSTHVRHQTDSTLERQTM